MKRLHYIQHVPFETPGSILDWATTAGVTLTSTRMFKDEPLPRLESLDCIVVMGGPMGVNDITRFKWLKAEKNFIETAVKIGKPVLGICLGAQLLADVLGAGVRKNRYKEIGWFPLTTTKENESIAATQFLPKRFTAFHWHGDTFDIPEGARRIAISEACENQGFVYHDRVIALQFHLEVTEPSLIEMVNNGRNELITDRYVQGQLAILENREHIRTNNEFMSRIMTNLTRNLCGDPSSSQQP